MGEDEEVPFAGKGKDSSFERGITDSGRGDNDNNGDNDQESKFHVRNETMSTGSSHGHGRDQDLGFAPTSNTAETEISRSDVPPSESLEANDGINQVNNSVHGIENETEEEDGDKSSKEEEEEEEEEDEDDEDTRRLLPNERMNHSQTWSAIEYLKEVINAIKGISDVLANNQMRVVEMQDTEAPQSEKEGQVLETVKREIEQKQMKIDDEEQDLKDRLDKSLEKSIVTMATFFISFHTLLANSQQSYNDFLRFVAVSGLIGIIWLAAIILLIICWCELSGLRDKIVSLDVRQNQLMSLANNTRGFERCIRPHLRLTTFRSNLYKFLIVLLGVVATGSSVYFGAITYSLWSDPSASASLLPAIQLPPTIQQLDAQSFASQ